MSPNYIILIFCSEMLISVCSAQFIIDPKKVCQFELNGKTLNIISEPIIINLRSPRLAIATSPCVHFSRLPKTSRIPNKFKKCASSSVACILKESSVVNAGDRFIYTEYKGDFDKEKVLESLNGDTCKNDKKYKIIIHFDCKGVTPSYVPPIDDEEDIFDPCTYHIRMIAPHCKPRCMVRVADQFLNLKDLAKLPDIVVPIESDTAAVLSMCRSAAICNVHNNATACMVKLSKSENGNSVTSMTATSVLGSVDTEQILWDDNNKQIYLRSQTGHNKRNRRVIEIRLVCNWNENSGSKSRLIKNVGKLIFEVESKFGCVKTNPICKATGNAGMSYNLENLYKTDNWLLDETSGRQIALNICGPLAVPGGSTCKKSYSQVCTLAGDLNFGSIMRPIEIEPYEHFLTTSLFGASACASNTSQYYSTNIKFICAFQNNQTAVLNDAKCNLDVIWETPEACPRYISNGRYCKVPNSYFEGGLIDLNALHTLIDRSIQISETVSLRYNFCGKLTTPCNNATDVSVCLINNGNESVLGRENNQVFFDNGIIRSYLYNSYDFDEDKPNMNLSFACNHKQPVEGSVSIYSLQDNVAYQMIIDTPLACTTNKLHSCTIIHENQLFDLTPLIKYDSNYEISTNKFTMQINICRPVIINSKSLCALNSLACLSNLTEPNLNKRFFSLGRKQQMTFHNNSLSLKYIHGSLCADSRSFAMETTILFKCSPNKESSPILLESNKCNYTIIWATKFACPKKLPIIKRSEKDCLIRSTNNILYNLTSLKKYSVVIELGDNASLVLNICTGRYHYFGENSQIASLTLIQKEAPYLEFELSNNYFIQLNLKCEPVINNEGFQIDPNFNKTWTEAKKGLITLSSSEICEKQTLDTVELSALAPALALDTEIIKSPEFTEVQYKILYTESQTEKYDRFIKKDCFITSLSFETFALNSLLPVFVQSSKHAYYIDFNNTVECMGYVCKDNKPFNNNTLDCPQYYLEDEILSIHFALINDSACKNKDLVGIKLFLECDVEENSAVIQESDCFVKIKLQTSSICPFLNINLDLLNNAEDISKYKLGGLIATSIIISILLIVVILRYLRKKQEAASPLLCGNLEFTSLVKQD